MGEIRAPESGMFDFSRCVPHESLVHRIDVHPAVVEQVLDPESIEVVVDLHAVERDTVGH